MPTDFNLERFFESGHSPSASLAELLPHTAGERPERKRLFALRKPSLRPVITHAKGRAGTSSGGSLHGAVQRGYERVTLEVPALAPGAKASSPAIFYPELLCNLLASKQLRTARPGGTCVLFAFLRLWHGWQTNREARPFPGLAVDCDVASVAFHDAMADAQPQTHPMSLAVVDFP